MTNAGRPMAADDIAFGVFAFHVVEEESWVTITSPSIPMTSVMWVILRETVAQARGLDYDVDRGSRSFREWSGTAVKSRPS